MVADYRLGKIYKIINSVNDIVYIGSTCQKLFRRMSGHRFNANNLDRKSKIYTSMRLIGIEKFKIILVKTFPCNSKENLEKMETRIIQRYIREGTVLYNTVINGGKGSDAGPFKRGSISFYQNRNSPYWRYYWMDNNKKQCKCFSINKYGDQRAKQMCIDLQNQIYPI